MRVHTFLKLSDAMSGEEPDNTEIRRLLKEEEIARLNCESDISAFQLEIAALLKIPVRFDHERDCDASKYCTCWVAGALAVHRKYSQPLSAGHSASGSTQQ